MIVEASISRAIETYVPKGIGVGDWQRLGATVRATVAATLPASTEQARLFMRVVAALAVWWDGEGGEPHPHAWLSRATIDRFTVEGCAHLAPATALNHRSTLHRVREAACWDGRGEPRPVRISGAREGVHGPYTRAELAGFRSWSLALPTVLQRHDASVLLALGRGCGLSADEIIRVRPANVRVLPSRMCVIDVPGRRPRLVVCRAGWEQQLAEACDAIEPDRYLFRPGRATVSRNSIANWLDRQPTHAQPGRLSVARLRTTWIVQLLEERLPLPVLVQAAGLTTLHSLSPFLRHLPPTSAQAAHRMLRGV